MKNKCDNCIYTFATCKGINQVFGGRHSDEVIECSTQVKFKGLKALEILYMYGGLILDNSFLEYEDLNLAIQELEALNEKESV